MNQDFLEMLKTRVASMEKHGYEVKTEFLNGYSKPKKINGFLPAATAEKDGHKIILQVEMCDFSLDNKEKYQAFSNIENAQLQVLAPKSCLMKIKSLVHNWDVKVFRWWRDSRF